MKKCIHRLYIHIKAFLRKFPKKEKLSYSNQKTLPEKTEKSQLNNTSNEQLLNRDNLCNNNVNSGCEVITCKVTKVKVKKMKTNN